MKRKSGWIIGGAAVALFLEPVFAQGPRALVVGRVIDERGVPVPNALVLYNNVPAWPANGGPGPGQLPRSPEVNWAVRGNSGGVFTVQDLPGGQYHFCATGTKLEQLRSCEWNQGRVVFPVQGPVTRIDLVVATGAVVRINVLDAQNRLQDQDSLALGSGQTRMAFGKTNFIIGLISQAGYYQRARLLGRKGQVWNYALTVPQGIGLQVLADSGLNIKTLAGGIVQKKTRSLSLPPLNQSGFTLDLTVE
jgi:hypothetical protein